MQNNVPLKNTGVCVLIMITGKHMCSRQLRFESRQMVKRLENCQWLWRHMNNVTALTVNFCSNTERLQPDVLLCH